MKGRGRLFAGLVIFLVYSFVLFNIAQAVDTAPPALPGSDGDPVVTKSYVDQEIVGVSSVVDTLTAEKLVLETKAADLELKVAALENQLNTIDAASGLFQVLELKSGQTLFLGSSTEFILRSGTATAISGVNGGLLNMTTGGKDLTTGQSVPLNNLLISSRDDGRGVKLTSTKVFVLVKGAYTIK